MFYRNKFGNKKVSNSKGNFDSKVEAKRFAELQLLERAGEITNLARQVEFVLLKTFKDSAGNTERGVKYIADFTYYDNKKQANIIEDVKSFITAKQKDYVIKRKLVKHFYPSFLFIESGVKNKKKCWLIKKINHN